MRGNYNQNYNQNQNTENFQIDICLSNEFNNIYNEHANAIAYTRKHRNHKCYMCKQYGHIASECGNICTYCKKYHPTTTCIQKLISLMSRILKKLDNSMNKNIVFLQKFINREYEDLEWILNKKKYSGLQIEHLDNVEIEPRNDYDYNALNTLLHDGFYNKILKDTYEKCNDEDEKEIHNFEIFNKFNKNLGFCYKLDVKEINEYKYYNVKRMNNYYKIDALNIKNIFIDEDKIEGFKIVKDDYYMSTLTKDDIKTFYDEINEKFNALRRSIMDNLRNKMNQLTPTYFKEIIMNERNNNKYKKLFKNNMIRDEQGNQLVDYDKISINVKNSLNEQLYNIKQNEQEIKRNKRNIRLQKELEKQNNQIKNQVVKTILNKNDYIIYMSKDFETLIKFCSCNHLNINVISKIFKTSPVCTIRKENRVMSSYLNTKLQFFSEITKDIKDLKEIRNNNKRLMKYNFRLETSANKKLEDLGEIMEKFNNLKEKYDNKNKELYERYKLNIDEQKAKYLRVKQMLDDKIERKKEYINSIYEGIDKMKQKSRLIKEDIDNMRKEQITMKKQRYPRRRYSPKKKEPQLTQEQQKELERLERIRNGGNISLELQQRIERLRNINRDTRQGDDGSEDWGQGNDDGFYD